VPGLLRSVMFGLDLWCDLAMICLLRVGFVGLIIALEPFQKDIYFMQGFFIRIVVNILSKQRVSLELKNRVSIEIVCFFFKSLGSFIENK